MEAHGKFVRSTHIGCMYIYMNILDNSVSAVWKLTGSPSDGHMLAVWKLTGSLSDDHMLAACISREIYLIILYRLYGNLREVCQMITCRLCA